MKNVILAFAAMLAFATATFAQSAEPAPAASPTGTSANGKPREPKLRSPEPPPIPSA